jgi:hypothetical protein
MARVVAGAGAGFHWMRLETRRKSSVTEKKSRESCKGS